LDELGHRIIEGVRAQGTKRLVIDAFGGFETAVQEPGRLTFFYAALANELRARGVTMYVAVEARTLISPSLAIPHSNISSIAENMIVLQSTEVQSTLHHTLSIFKIRDSEFDPRVRELLFSADGMRLGGSFGAAEKVLTGAARGSSGSSNQKS
jgi:circadian clock protein KaiC